MIGDSETSTFDMTIISPKDNDIHNAQPCNCISHTSKPRTA